MKNFHLQFYMRNPVSVESYDSGTESYIRKILLFEYSDLDSDSFISKIKIRIRIRIRWNQFSRFGFGFGFVHFKN